jgi:hypothetical protein
MLIRILTVGRTIHGRGEGGIDKGGHRHRSQCRRNPTSDIDICYSDIGEKYVGLKNVIPISASELIPISDIEEKNISSCRFESTSLRMVSERYNTELLCLSVCKEMSDIEYRYRIKVYSDIRDNVRLRSLSPISEVPISGSV